MFALFGWRQPPYFVDVIVTVKDDQPQIRGVLVASRGAWLVLRNADVLHPDGTPARHVDGEMYIPRELVAFVQVPRPRD